MTPGVLTVERKATETKQNTVAEAGWRTEESLRTLLDNKRLRGASWTGRSLSLLSISFELFVRDENLINHFVHVPCGCERSVMSESCVEGFAA